MASDPAGTNRAGRSSERYEDPPRLRSFKWAATRSRLLAASSDDATGRSAWFGGPVEGYFPRMPRQSDGDQPTGAAPWIPGAAGLDRLRSAAQDCRGCELYEDATQAVLGEGSPDAKVVFVGEQPGDQEDRQGRPFVGPAGRLLDQALDDCRRTTSRVGSGTT